MVIAVVDRNPDQNRPLGIECLLENRRDIFRRADHQTLRAKGFGVLDGINRAEGDSGHTAVFLYFLGAHHVVGAIRPDHVDEMRLQPDDGA